MSTAEITIDDKYPMVRISRTFNAPPANVFRADVEPDLFAKWNWHESFTIHFDHPNPPNCAIALRKLRIPRRVPRLRARRKLRPTRPPTQDNDVSRMMAPRLTEPASNSQPNGVQSPELGPGLADAITGEKVIDANLLRRGDMNSHRRGRTQPGEVDCRGLNFVGH
jgi:hypothetical protein